MMNDPILPWKSLSASLQVGVLTDGWGLAEAPIDGTEKTRVFLCSVCFDNAFEAPPLVHLSLTGFDLDQRDSSRLSVRAIEINRTGFIAEIATWRDTRVYSVEFSWLALGA